MSGDRERTYTPEEERALTENLRALTVAVYRGDLRPRDLNLALLRELHAKLFGGVRSHAGRVRSRGYGSEYLVFGPHRSVKNADVDRKLKDLFGRVERERREIDADSADSADDRDRRAIRFAVEVHAEIIRIHPFEDGNGRTSRLVANHLIVQLGLRPVAIETVKQEYLDALNRYFTTNDLDVIVDLYLRLYPAV